MSPAPSPSPTSSPSLAPTLSATPSGELLARIGQLNDAARPFSAWQLAQECAPLAQWQGINARREASRIAIGLGNQRLGRVLSFLNYRRNREDVGAFLSYVGKRAGRLGPLAVEQLLSRRLANQTALAPLSPSHRADLLGLKGLALARLRDFEPAHAAITQALELKPEEASLHGQHSCILELEDRYAEALDVARHAFALAPHRPACVMQVVDCLIHLGHDDEACAMLIRAHEEGEVGDYATRLVLFYSEREDHERALHYLDEHDRRFPLLDKHGREWSLRRRADLLYMAGDHEACLAACDQLPADSYHGRIAANMRRPGALEGRRKRLPVPFVRQHNMTCAPATLAALAAYWKLEFHHLAISEAICHHGTPWHKERQWAEENGFIASEFRLTREILIALIDRGVPFTLTTESVTSAHLQACIGYDERQGVALLRDPTERHFGEVILEGLIEDHPVQGPRCMLLLPKAEAHRLEGLTLPDASSFDGYHHFLLAIDRHDREAACSAIAAIPEESPLRSYAELCLAGYDRNAASEYELIEQLLRRFPKNSPLRYYRLRIVQRLSNFALERELLSAELSRKECDPIFCSEMGELLMRDARHFSLADFYLRKAVRQRPETGSVYANLAYCRWKERRFEEAARHHRAAATLQPTFEPYASDYADACRAIGRPEEGVAFLRQRVRQQGQKSNGPWFTLADELNTQGRTPEAVACLEERLAARPDDGAMRLGAGKRFLSSGDPQRGEALMQAARGHVREAEWLSEMAGLATTFGRRQEAIERWRAYLTLEPQAIAAHRAMARLLAEEEGEHATLQWLEEATTRWPKNPSLWSLRAEWQACELGPEAAIVSLEEALKLNPDSTWTLRELAIRHFRAGNLENSFAYAQEAINKEPQSPDSYRILGFLQEENGQITEAVGNFRKTLSISIDQTEAAKRLVSRAPTPQKRLEALTFIECEMRRQVSNGDIVPEYRTLAYRLLKPADLLKKLEEFCSIRPDLWQTWSARLEQALDMDLPDATMTCAQAFVERFPLLPRAWTDLASVHQTRGEHEEEIAALQKAVALSPGWDWAQRTLAAALERLARYDEAEAVLRKTLLSDPLTGANHGCLADLLWNRGRHEEALEQLLKGMHHCPSYDWGWPTLAEWAMKLNRQDEVATLLDFHTPRQGHFPGWWITCSETLDTLNRHREALEALKRGLQRHPAHPELLDQQCVLLVNCGRFEEALAVAQGAIARFPEDRRLAGRHAWVLMNAGYPKEAIAKMATLVKQQPDYLWGLEHLCGWLQEREEWKSVREHAENWMRLDPRQPRAHSCLAQACLALKDRAGAKAAFLKAYALAPAYLYAGRQLLSLQIEDEEFKAAGETLRSLEHYAGSAMTTADAVELAVGMNDLAEATRRARQLLEAEDVSVPLLEWMPELFAKLGKEKRWWKLLDKAAAGKAPVPAVMAAWVRSLRQRRRLFKAPWRLDRLRAPHAQEARVAGWIALLETASPETAFRTRRWIFWRRRWLRSRNDLWAAAGNALVGCSLSRKAAPWFADWKERFGEQGEGGDNTLSCMTLFNCGIALEEIHGWKAAVEVREYALNRFPHTTLTPSLRTVIALNHAIQGDDARAQALMNEVETDKLIPFYKSYHTLCRSLLHASTGKAELAILDYRDALKALNGLSYDRGVASVIKGTQKQLSKVLPWARGSRRAVAKQWGGYEGSRNLQQRFVLRPLLTLIIIVTAFRTIQKILEAIGL